MCNCSYIQKSSFENILTSSLLHTVYKLPKNNGKRMYV